jgi:hypothetical protein
VLLDAALLPARRDIAEIRLEEDSAPPSPQSAR